MFVCLCVCVSVFWERSVPIGREPTDRDAEFLGAVKRSLLIGREGDNEFLGAVKRSLLIGREGDKESVPIGRGNGAFGLVGNRPIGTRSSDWLSNRAFRLVGGIIIAKCVSVCL